MPHLREIKKAHEIGKEGYFKYIWLACPRCLKERWVYYLHYLHSAPERQGICLSCAQRENGAKLRAKLHTQRRKTTKGYILVRIPPNSFFSPMANKQGMCLEHRKIVAQNLGRCLLPWEIVHHKNGTKDDNRYPQNLELITDKRFHLVDFRVKRYIKGLESKIKRLEEMLPLQSQGLLDTKIICPQCGTYPL